MANCLYLGSETQEGTRLLQCTCVCVSGCSRLVDRRSSKQTPERLQAAAQDDLWRGEKMDMEGQKKNVRKKKREKKTEPKHIFNTHSHLLKTLMKYKLNVTEICPRHPQPPPPPKKKKQKREHLDTVPRMKERKTQKHNWHHKNKNKQCILREMTKGAYWGTSVRVEGGGGGAARGCWWVPLPFLSQLGDPARGSLTFHG